MTGAQGGSKISTGRDDIACDSVVLPMLSKCFDIQLANFEPENATMNGDYLLQGVENVNGGIPTILEVWLRFLFMSLRRIQLTGSLSPNLFDPMRHQLDLRKVKVSI
jgi:hypothetical protein